MNEIEFISPSPDALKFVHRIIIAATWVLAILLTIVMFSFEYQRWDGVIYQYAVLTRNFSGVDLMHWEVGSLTQYGLFNIIEWFSRFFGKGTLILFSYFGLISCIFGIFLVIVSLSPDGISRWAAAFAAVILPLGALVTTAMLAPFFMLTGFGLIGAVLLARDRIFCKAVGIVLVALGMQVFHAAGAMLMLAIVVYVRRNARVFGGRKSNQGLAIAVTAIAAFNVLIFFILRAILPSSGAYAGYDAAAQVPDFSGFAYLFWTNSAGIGFPFFCVVLAALPLFFRPEPNSLGPSDLAWRQSLFVWIGLGLTVLANTVPFVLTDRTVATFPTILNNGANLDLFRYNFAGMIVAQIALGILLTSLFRRNIPSRLAWSAVLVLVFAAFSCAIYFWNNYVRLDRLSGEIVSHWRQLDVSNSWAEVICELPADDPVQKYGYRYVEYELHYLYFVATGKTDRFLCDFNCDPARLARDLPIMCQSDAMRRIHLLNDADCDAIQTKLLQLSSAKQVLPMCY